MIILLIFTHIRNIFRKGLEQLRDTANRIYSSSSRQYEEVELRRQTTYSYGQEIVYSSGPFKDSHDAD